MKKIYLISLTIIFTALFFPIKSQAGHILSNYPEISTILNTGDSLLLLREVDSAREQYQRAFNFCEASSDVFFYIEYKLAYSYRIEQDYNTSVKLVSELYKEILANPTSDSAFRLLLEAEVFCSDKENVLTEIRSEDIEDQFNKRVNSFTRWGRTRMYYLLSKCFLSDLNFSKSSMYSRQVINSEFSDPYSIDLASVVYMLSLIEQKEHQRAVELGLEYLHDNNGFLDTIFIYHKLGFSYLLLRNYENALQMFTKQLEIAEKHKKGVLSDIHISIANCYILMGEKDEAYKYYSNAYKITHSELTSTPKLINSINGMLYYYYKTQEYEQTRKYLEELSSLIRKVKINKWGELDASVRLVRGWRRLNENDKAISEANYILSKQQIYNSESWYDLHQVMRSRGVAYYKIWAKDSSDVSLLLTSYNDFKESVRLAKNMFNSVQTKTERYRQVSDLKQDYNNVIICGIELYYRTDSTDLMKELYDYVEDSKGLMFRYNMHNSQAIRSAGIPPELEQMEGAFKSEIVNLRRDVENLSKTEIESEEGRKKIVELNRFVNSYDSLKSTFKEEYSDYFELLNTSNKNALKTTREKLVEDQVLIDYYTGENRLFAFFISQDSTIFMEIPVQKSFLEDIVAYRKLIENPQQKGSYRENFQKFVSLSHNLYQNLLGPFEKLIKDKRLIILPHVELNYIPFETLVVDTASAMVELNYSELKYLLNTNPVSVIYTGQQLKKTKKKINTNSKYIGFAPTYSNNTIRISALEGADQEVGSISKFFNGKNYTGKEANKDQFLNEAPKYPIVHMAMHTIINEEDPMFSQLLFSSEKSQELDTLFIYELFGHRFETDLLVISGCNSGYGALNPGEGILNLARTFFYSGIDNIIVTQWAIADKSSSQLMQSFYKHFSEGMPADRALQKAKIDYLKNADPMRHHPYYWSGYELVGDSVYSVKTFKYSFVIYLLSVLLLLSLILVYIKKARK